MARRPSWRVGDVYKVALEGGRQAFAVLCESPVAGFSTGIEGGQPANFEAISFYAMIHRDGLRRWEKVAHLSEPPAATPWFFKQDALSKQLRLQNYLTGEEKAAGADDVMRHEPAVIWEPEQIEDRLNRGPGAGQFQIVEEMRAFAIRTAPSSR